MLKIEASEICARIVIVRRPRPARRQVSCNRLSTNSPAEPLGVKPYLCSQQDLGSSENVMDGVLRNENVDGHY